MHSVTLMSRTNQGQGHSKVTLGPRHSCICRHQLATLHDSGMHPVLILIFGQVFRFHVGQSRVESKWQTLVNQRFYVSLWLGKESPIKEVRRDGD